jgi:hypothetical protein
MESGRLLVLQRLHAAHAAILRGHDVQTETILADHAEEHASPAHAVVCVPRRPVGTNVV